MRGPGHDGSNGGVYGTAVGEWLCEVIGRRIIYYCGVALALVFKGFFMASGALLAYYMFKMLEYKLTF